jgi:hypothetical protein
LRLAKRFPAKTRQVCFQPALRRPFNLDEFRIPA